MEENKTFEILKKQIVDLASKHTADNCAAFLRCKNTKTEAELLSCIYDNIYWCIQHKVISHEYFSQFDPQTYLESGLANTGKENTGLVNSGDSNSGNLNSSDRNSGDSNSGNYNSGKWNSGNWNSGYWNSGYWNSGAWNSGYRNSGNWNSGNWNSGDSNSGDSNSGYRNSGAFCADPNPKVWMFDKPTNINVRDWEQSRPFNIMANYLNFTFWINSSEMTEKEKESWPKHETTGGYLKTIPYKEGWANMWDNLSDSDKKEFTSLPNFDSNIFFEITGIKI